MEEPKKEKPKEEQWRWLCCGPATLPLLGKNQLLVAVVCVGVATLASLAAMITPEWVSFSFKDLEYQVQNSRSVLPLLPKSATVDLKAGMLNAKVCWDSWPNSFAICKGTTGFLNIQYHGSGASCSPDLMDTSFTCSGCTSGTVSEMVAQICDLSFNYTTWSTKIMNMSHPTASELCLKDSIIVSMGKLCDPDRLFFRVGYPGYSTMFLLALDLVISIAALTLLILAMRPNHWHLQLKVGCCPLARGAASLCKVASIFSFWPPLNFVLQSALERGMPQVINQEGNNVEPVVPSDVSTTQGSDVTLTFGWGLVLYAPLAQICLVVATVYATKAWKQQELQYKQNKEFFFPGSEP